MKRDKAVVLKNLVRYQVRSYQKCSQHRPRGLGGRGNARRLCRTSGSWVPSKARRNGLVLEHPRILLLQIALGGRGVDKAQWKEIKDNYVPSHGLLPPWILGDVSFPRAWREKTVTQYLINYLSCHCSCWPHSDTSPL